MKKFFLFIALIIIFLEIKDHPSVAPTVSEIKNTLLSDAKSRFKVVDPTELPRKLNALQTKLVTHEMNYVKKHITDIKTAQVFWGANCQNTGLAHSVLTQYAKKEICQIIQPYVQE